LNAIVRVLGDQTLEEAFPEVDPGLVPFGERVLLQIKTPPTKTKSGLFLTENTRQTDADTCQVAKVIALGKGAFKHRTSGQSWWEGEWFDVGAFVRVPRYLGDRWEVKHTDDVKVVFAIMKDLEVLGRVDDPLTMRSFI